MGNKLFRLSSLSQEEVNNDEQHESGENHNVIKDNENNKTPKVVPHPTMPIPNENTPCKQDVAVIDPRSPTVGLSRTPLVAEDGTQWILRNATGADVNNGFVGSPRTTELFIREIETLPFVDEETEKGINNKKEKDEDIKDENNENAEMLLHQVKEKKRGHSLRNRMHGLRESFRRLSMHNAASSLKHRNSPTSMTDSNKNQTTSFDPAGLNNSANESMIAMHGSVNQSISCLDSSRPDDNDMHFSSPLIENRLHDSD